MIVPSRHARVLFAALCAALPAQFARAQVVPAEAAVEPPAAVEPDGLTPLPAAQETEPATGLSSFPALERPRSPVADILEAEPPVTPYAEPLSLEFAIARALEANFDIQIQRRNAAVTTEAEEIARAGYDPTLVVSATTGQFQTTRATVDSNGNIIPTSGVRTDTDQARVSVTQRIPLGTTITGTSRLNRTERNIPVNTFNPAYDSDIGIVIRQPLLRGAGSTINNAAIERARLGTERARADFAARVFTVVRDVEIAYSLLALAREQVGIRAFSLEVRKKLLEENRARRDTGVATDLEVLQAEVGVASAARDLLLARQTARDREDELLRLLGHESFEHPVGPVALPPEGGPAIDIGASLERARANTPEYFSALAAIRQQEIDVRTAKNNRLPQLDLSAGAGYSSTDPTLREAGTGLWDGDGYDWQVGLSLSVPWGFREERARLRQARAGREREELRLAQVEQDILVSVRNAVRALETNAENLRLSTLTAQLSEREFEVEKARYDSGLSTFRRVQEAQDRFDQSRIAELQAKVNLRVAQANLDRLEGTAPGRYRLTLAP
jgi:outer membrane protein TolC